MLNNSGIPRMVRGYFYEMACVIGECARVLKPNARLFMVNDNVRYAGVSISVDTILSDIARSLGFAVEQILVVPGRKETVVSRWECMAGCRCGSVSPFGGNDESSPWELMQEKSLHL